jgi:uncharacterized protein YkwD
MQTRTVFTAAIFFGVLVLTLAACGDGASTEGTPIDSPPTQAEAASVFASSTQTPAVVLPINNEIDTGRLDAALVPDAVTVSPGVTFVQSWRIRNTGALEWNDSAGPYLVTFVGGDRMNGPSSVALADVVLPGAEIELDWNLTAPNSAGLYEGRWRVQDPAGQPISSEFSVRIEVPAEGAGPADAEPVTDAAQSDPDRSLFIVSAADSTTQGDSQTPEVRNVGGATPAEPRQGETSPAEFEEGCLDAALVADVTIPDGAVVNPGDAFTKVWRIRNTGTCEWSPSLGQFQWAFVGGEQMNGPNQVPIAGAIPPGGETDIEVGLTAPEAAGLYEGRWQVHDPNGNPVGVAFWVLIEVPGASSTPALGDSAPSEGVDLGQEVWRNINGERTRLKLYQLAYNEKLALAAQAHAEDCSGRGSCSHTGSDGSDEADRVRRVGFEGTVDESWAWSASPVAAVNWWLDEVPPNDWHRRMLLSEYLTQVGVGVAPAESGYYFVAVFGITGH